MDLGDIDKARLDNGHRELEGHLIHPSRRSGHFRTLFLSVSTPPTPPHIQEPAIIQSRLAHRGPH
jgi:hypothetical protein